MVFWPHIPGILTPYQLFLTRYLYYIEPPTQGVLTHLPIVFWPPTMLYWIPHPWYSEPPTNGISNRDDSYQVAVHFAEGFQRTRWKCEKLMDDGRRTPSDGKSSHCLWEDELKNILPDWLKNKHSTNKNRQHTFWHIWVSCFYCVLPINKKHKLFKKPSNKHFYKVCFQMA